jgi:serine/threonine-protein kinase
MTQENLAGRFTILRELGRGAIGAVYAARDASTGLVVALKILDPALFSESGAKLAELFLKNARAAARLRHRNIARVFDAGEAGGTAFVAMELVEGESLRRLLDQRPLSIARAIQIFDDIASALAYAHEEGMVHRGVKPSNIIVLPAGMAKIGDFGLGQIGEAALRYMSPEQARGEPLDHRSDLFSLGAVFYEMLTRRAPFEGDSPQQIRQSIVQAQPPLPSKVNPHVPGALDAMVSRLLAARPDERFADARVLLRDLQRVEEEIGLGPGAGAAASEPKPSVPPRAIEPTLRTAVAAPARVRDPAPILADEPLPERHAPFLKDPEPRPEPSSGSGATFLAALALMFAVLSIGLTVVLYYSPDLIERLILASGLREAPTPATAPAPSPSTAAAPSPSPVQQPVSEAINHAVHRVPEPVELRVEPKPEAVAPMRIQQNLRRIFRRLIRPQEKDLARLVSAPYRRKILGGRRMQSVEAIECRLLHLRGPAAIEALVPLRRDRIHGWWRRGWRLWDKPVEGFRQIEPGGGLCAASRSLQYRAVG